MTNPHDKAIEAAAKAVDPDLFSDDPVVAHRAASPFTVEAARKPVIDNLTRAIAAYERAMWRPIEEAPHNRTVILGWRDWRDGKWCMEVGAATWGERVGDYSNRSQHGSATHFRPLPPVPEGE